MDEGDAANTKVAALEEEVKALEEEAEKEKAELAGNLPVGHSYCTLCSVRLPGSDSMRKLHENGEGCGEWRRMWGGSRLPGRSLRETSGLMGKHVIRYSVVPICAASPN